MLHQFNTSEQFSSSQRPRENFVSVKAVRLSIALSGCVYLKKPLYNAHKQGDTMAASNELIIRTFEVIEPGDCLMLTGGTFPGQNEEATVQINVAHIIPYMNVFATALGNRHEADKHPIRDNPLGFTEEHAEEVMKRNDGRFRFDAADPWFRAATKVALLGEIEVDMVAIGANIQPDFYFVTKPK